MHFHYRSLMSHLVFFHLVWPWSTSACGVLSAVVLRHSKIKSSKIISVQCVNYLCSFSINPISSTACLSCWTPSLLFCNVNSHTDCLHPRIWTKKFRVHYFLQVAKVIHFGQQLLLKRWQDALKCTASSRLPKFLPNASPQALQTITYNIT